MSDRQVFPNNSGTWVGEQLKMQLLSLTWALLALMIIEVAVSFMSPIVSRQAQVGGPGVGLYTRRFLALHAVQRESLSMSDPGAMGGSKSKGGVKVGVKEKEDVKVSPKEKEKFEVEWRVLLHNDDVHTFDYVSRKLSEVVPTLTKSKAWECTLAAHSHDFATLAIVTKTTAEDYCMKLQKAGLTISVAPDSNFQKDGEGAGGFKGQ